MRPALLRRRNEKSSDNYGVTGGNPPPWIRGVNFVRAQARFPTDNPEKRDFGFPEPGGNRVNVETR